MEQPTKVMPVTPEQARFTGENDFRFPKYAFAQGAPRELVTILRTKVPAKQ